MIKDILENNQDVRANTTKLAALREHFAGCFTSDGAFDMERFKEMLRDEVDVKSEGYSLNFLGKDYANLIASVDTTTVVVPDVEHNSKPENKDSENVYISGDNLDALKHLLKSYAGQVKCIYIDPPYNTGTDGFVYNDRFCFTSEQLQKRLSVDEDEAKRILDMTSRGSSTHSAWLMFMSPRLQLARQLLSKDGVIFISIDENEHCNLKLLCDYVFGEENFAGEVIWKNSSKNDEDYISMQHEYILCYVKNKEYNKGAWIELKQGTDEIFAAFDNFKKKHGNDWKAIHEEALVWYKQFRESNPIYDNKHYNWMDERGVYFASDISGPNPGQYVYEVIHPQTGKPCKMPENGWRFEEKEMESRIENGLIHFPKDEKTIPNNKTYLKDTLNQSLTSLIYRDGRVASKNLTALMGTNCFSNPKDPDVITKLFSAVGLDTGDIVLDFFSGSGTTAESVMSLKKIGKDLSFILVQIQEDLDNSLQRVKGKGKTIVRNAINLCDALLVPHTVDQIGQERIKRAAAKIKAENPLFAGDLGFKHYTLKEVPENVLDKMEEFNPEEATFGSNMLELFGRETVLATWKVRDGYGLTSEVEEVQLADYTAYQCGDHLYLLDEGLDDDAITAMVDKYGEPTPWNPHHVVLFGYNMNFGVQDALKTNLPLLNEGEKQVKINIDVRY